MQTVGGELRKARLEKNLSLDQVYRQTKIYPRVLEALEEDRAHNFLGTIYVKGFLKSYSQFLGLNAEKLTKEYMDSHQKEPAPAKVVPESEEGQPAPARKVSSFFVLRVVLIIGLSIAFIFYFRFVLKRISMTARQPERQMVTVTVAPVFELKPEVKPEVKDLVLEVRTIDACWLHVKADEQVIFQQTIPKGKQERWQAKEKVELRIGKPEALEVLLNGKPIDLKKAKVRKGLVITHKGIVGK